MHLKAACSDKNDHLLLLGLLSMKVFFGNSRGRNLNFGISIVSMHADDAVGSSRLGDKLLSCCE